MLAAVLFKPVEYIRRKDIARLERIDKPCRGI
jgi:hypothetical protein